MLGFQTAPHLYKQPNIVQVYGACNGFLMPAHMGLARQQVLRVKMPFTENRFEIVNGKLSSVFPQLEAQEKLVNLAASWRRRN